MKSNIQTPDRRVVSAILILFISLLTAMMNCNNLTPNGSTDLHAETGTAQINIDIGAIGTIAKKKTIELERLIFTLSCSDEDTIRDTIDISGSGGNNVQKTIGDLAAPKQWRLSAITLDEQDSCIHAGSTTFTTEPADTIDVSLELDARFSMLRVSFNGIPDSATTLSIDVDAGDFSSDSTFEATSRDTVVLTYDYLTATAEGDTHTVSLNVRGVYHGISTILYTADTTLTVISGEDRNYTVTLTWVGPFINEPPVFSTEETDMTDSIYAGTVYRDTVSFSDPDGDDVTLLFGEHPDGMTVEDSIILWTTELSDTGNHTIILIARNGNGGYDTLEWTIEVVPPPVSNHPPVFTSSASDMLSSVYVDSDYIDTIHATDSDGDEISFTLIGDAEGLTLDDTILTWMPTEDDIGTYNISAIADDGNGGTDTLEWTIRVRSNSTPDYPEIPFDSIMTGEINPSVDVDQYWFQGTAGDIITLRVDPDGGGNSAYPDSRILLINPDDSVLINQN
ncbi:MAG: hypothetical protein JW863_10170, partial [Chitinispirillaceae bacterium]|nr:hypothetical protein [Chitinispirillaceae bacterium]